MVGSMLWIARRIYTVSMAKPEEVHWTHSLGTVGKGSPVVADGKIYVTEVNGHFLILQPGENECKTLSTIQIEREPVIMRRSTVHPPSLTARSTLPPRKGFTAWGFRGLPLPLQAKLSLDPPV